MNEDGDNMAKQTSYDIPELTNRSAEEVLFGFTNELRHPIASLEGYTKMLSITGADQVYVTGILGNIERLREMCDSIRVYLMQKNFLSQENEIMQFLREKVFDRIIYSQTASQELKEMVVKNVRMLNSTAAWQMIDSWLHMTSHPADFDIIQKMKQEGFTEFESTLDEFQNRFAQDTNRPT
jgi:hypothetical protein